MTLENIIPFLSKKPHEGEQATVQNANTLQSPNQRRVLRNEVAAKIATLKKAA